MDYMFISCIIWDEKRAWSSANLESVWSQTIARPPNLDLSLSPGITSQNGSGLRPLKKREFGMLIVMVWF